ncbi:MULTISPECIES: phage tail tube protein [unclassified Pseudovibrio]|uniref:phage tail tube protein n=1 Tax=unclassified Pseudovibrio TaxID=2627060 RepID=UPI00070A6DD1|nr:MULTISPECIES: phage tail tube protein [unclassified Pseudovibrio]KZK99149.1 Phage major tail protein 2 [Pseudovibrio sp. Ad26]
MAGAESQGKLMLIQLGNGGDPETFESVCGVKDKSLSINNEVVDTTRPNCDNPSAPLNYSGAYGIRTISLSGNGVATSSETYQRVVQHAVGQVYANAKIIVPLWGTFTGTVVFNKVDVSGPMQGELEFSLELTMTGDITFELDVLT